MVYTVGYQLRPLADLLGQLSSAGIDVVVDVRENPWSYQPGYRRQTLEAALEGVGIGYVHASFAGNPKRFRKEANSHQECLDLYAAYLEENPGVITRFSTLITELTENKRKVCILCYERHPADCHRLSLLNAVGVSSVEHLGVDGAPRFIEA